MQEKFSKRNFKPMASVCQDANIMGKKHHAWEYNPWQQKTV